MIHYVMTWKIEYSNDHYNITRSGMIDAENVAEILMRCEALRLKYKEYNNVSIIFLHIITEQQYNQYADYVGGFEVSLKEAKEIFEKIRNERK